MEEGSSELGKKVWHAQMMNLIHGIQISKWPDRYPRHPY